ncbi:MAG: outer membrane beta-barrel protein [Bacteroidota bacterium]
MISKRLPWCFFFLLFPLLLFGQVTETERSGWGVEFFPHLANNRLINGSTLGFREARRRDSLEVATFGYGVGVFYALRGEKLGYHLGVRLLSTGYETLRGPFDLELTNDEYSEEFTATLLEIPFQLNFYQNLSPKASFFFTLGAMAGINLQNKTVRTRYFTDGSVTTEDFEPNVTYRSVNFGMIAALGFEFNASKNLTLGIQPNFEYWLGGNVSQSEDGLTRNFYTLGAKVYAMFARE